MLIVVSPAKKLNMEPAKDVLPTEPVFAEQARELAAVADKLSLDELQKLMGLSPSLAQLNAERFGAFGKQQKKPAALAFAGDTYQGLEAASFDPHEMVWAQDHLRILSGSTVFCDRSMQLNLTGLKWEAGCITKRVPRSMPTGVLNWRTPSINRRRRLALLRSSIVHRRSISALSIRGALEIPVISPVFKERKNGKEKIVSFFAKKARGAMARFVVQHRITTPSGLMDFTGGGYEFQPCQSDTQKMVFVRDYPVTA